MEIEFQLVGGAMESWIVQEFKSLELGDKRLNQRSNGKRSANHRLANEQFIS
jgi:hypothetical protein